MLPPHAWTAVENNPGLDLGGKPTASLFDLQHSYLTEALIPVGEGSREDLHLTGDLTNEIAMWALISCCVFLGIWKADGMFKKDQRGTQLLTHLSLNLKPENESCDIFVNCLIIKCVYQPTHRPPW